VTCGVAKLLPVQRRVPPPGQATSRSTPRAKNSTGGAGLAYRSRGFASVLSVGSHDRTEPLDFFYNPQPPVEFFARGVDIDVAWLEGATLRCTGNSFATPHMSGICALVLGAHPELTPFQLKSVLYLTSSNVIGSL